MEDDRGGGADGVFIPHVTCNHDPTSRPAGGDDMKDKRTFDVAYNSTLTDVSSWVM